MNMNMNETAFNKIRAKLEGFLGYNFPNRAKMNSSLVDYSFYDRIKHELDISRQELDIARSNFNNSNEDFIEVSIEELKNAENNYNVALKKMKTFYSYGNVAVRKELPILVNTDVINIEL